ncbi:hypothetical protein BJY52DRAFT_278070 [Lactarius psammicola]|nr:hypothetical protein BJY52DRAFT_278070 [Lactarius psammicola]
MVRLQSSTWMGLLLLLYASPWRGTKPSHTHPSSGERWRNLFVDPSSPWGIEPLHLLVHRMFSTFGMTPHPYMKTIGPPCIAGCKNAWLHHRTNLCAMYLDPKGLVRNELVRCSLLIWHAFLGSNASSSVTRITLQSCSVWLYGLRSPHGTAGVENLCRDTISSFG